MLEYIKTIKLRWSDLFLLIYGVFGTLICMESNYLMMNQNPLPLRVPLFVYIIFFIVYIGAFIIYAFLELKREGINRAFIVSAFLLLIALTSSTISIFSTGNTIVLDVEGVDQITYTITTILNTETKIIHYFSILFFVLSIYVLVIFFSKRIDNIKFISLVIYIFYFVTLVALIISLFKDDYALLFKTMFSGEEFEERIEELAPISIFGNKNIYGKFLELGLFVSLANYSLTKKKHNLFIGAYYYIHLLISICKVGILCATVVLVIYLIIYLVLSIIDRSKKDIIIFGSLVGAVLLAVLIILILILTNDSVRNLYDYFISHLHSLLSRTEIWSYSYQIANNISLPFGAGYGIFNSILYNTLLTINEEAIWCAHSFLFSLLGRDGIFGVLLYFAIIVYSTFLTIKLLPKNKYLVISILALEISFMIHSCFEDYYDMVFLSMMLLMVIDNINKNNKPLTCYQG